MKCKHCDGTGKSNMYKDGDFIDCMYCCGTGEIEVEQTEQEYLQTCNTEQLAEAIYNFVWCSNELWQQLCCNGDVTNMESDLRIVREWLKQPHKL